MDKNSQILSAVDDWRRIVLEEYKSNCSARFSHIFYMGLSDEYMSAEKGKRIMVIGREARGFEPEDSDNDAEKNTPFNSQQWSIAYFERQVYKKVTPLPKCYGDRGITSNRSPFWNLFRRLTSAGFAPCWNNIDKVYRVDKGKLTTEDEKILSRQYSTGSGSRVRSLLVREIEIARPDMLLFVTGGSYRDSMQTALGMDDIPSSPQYNKDDTCLVRFAVETGRDAGDGFEFSKIPAYWINHPQALMFKRFTMQDISDIIISQFG